jgi:uncharacterized protein (DUF488 family)
MKQTPLTLAYRNEDDKAYGLAGMILSLGDLGAMESIVEVSLDNDGPMVRFTDSYYYATSPTYSPKNAWEGLKHNFYITAAMVVANVMSRSLVRDRVQVPKQLLDEIFAQAVEEGRATCCLDRDEVKALFDHIVMRCRRLFDNPRIHPAIRDLSDEIALKRSMTAEEIVDLLQEL